jgi:hypothetical protein
MDIARCPYHDHHPLPQHPRRDKANFSVILAIVLAGKVLSCKHQRSILKIQTTFFQGLLALGGIIGDLH